MSRLLSETAQLARYGVVGITTNLSLYLVFVAMLWLGLSPVLAAALCYVLGVTLSYLLNRKFTFDSKSGHRADLPKFLLAYGIGFVATMVFIQLLVQWMQPELAQVFNIGMTAVVIYIALRLLRFGQKGTADGA